MEQVGPAAPAQCPSKNLRSYLQLQAIKFATSSTNKLRQTPMVPNHATGRPHEERGQFWGSRKREHCGEARHSYSNLYIQWVHLICWTGLSIPTYVLKEREDGWHCRPPSTSANCALFCSQKFLGRTLNRWQPGLGPNSDVRLSETSATLNLLNWNIFTQDTWKSHQRSSKSLLLWNASWIDTRSRDHCTARALWCFAMLSGSWLAFTM